MANREKAPPGGGVSEIEKPLESWKEIAAYLNKGVTTVQRWESEEGLPVHRLQHKKRGNVFAYPSELDRWRRSRSETASSDSRPLVPLSRLSTQWTVIGGLAVLAVATALMATGFVATRRPAPSAPYPATSYAGVEQHPSLSPNGTKLAFAWDGGTRNFDIWVKDLPAGEPYRITETPDREGSPRWSPDGQSLAFVRWGTRALQRTVLVSDLKGGERRIHTVEQTRRQGIFAEWAPDGKALIVSDRASPAAPLRVERILLADLSRQPLTRPPDSVDGDFYGAVSPDGWTLAFARCKTVDTGCHLWVRTLPDGAERRVTGKETTILGLAWMPDSSTLLFSSNWSGRQQIWRIGVHGSSGEPERVGGEVGVHAHPSVSMRADRQPHVGYEQLIRHDHVWRMDLSRAESARKPEQVTRSTWSDVLPVLSPDGLTLAFASDQSGFLEVWLTAADGRGHARQFTRLEKSSEPCAWSPDGERITFRKGIGKSVETRDGSFRELGIPEGSKCAFWSRDGRTLYFLGPGSDAAAGLWAKPTGAGPVRRLANTGVFLAKESPDGQSIYFTKHARLPTGLWQVSREGGPETLAIEGVRSSAWAVSDRGIYYLKSDPSTDLHYLPAEIYFHEFSSGQNRRVGYIAGHGNALSILPGLDVSRDGRWIYWSQRDYWSQDLVFSEP